MFSTIDSKSLELRLVSSLRSPSLSKSMIKKLPNALEIVARECYPTLKKQGVSKLSMSITICGRRKIQTLNRDYRNKDKPTDVLSFPLFDDLRQFKDTWPGPMELGDIVICWPKVLQQALEFKITPEQEFIHLFVHGYLHLLGYDHELSRNEELIMEKYEQKLVGRIYKEFGWSRK